MVYVKRDERGQIIALSRDATARDPAQGWVEVSNDAPDVVAFCSMVSDEVDALRRSDLGFVRVLEDVIDLLIERSIIRFTDLPLAAQSKLMERRSARAERHKLSLLDDGDGLI